MRSIFGLFRSSLPTQCHCACSDDVSSRCLVVHESFEINLFNALNFVCIPQLRMKYVFIKIFLEAKEIV